MPLQRSGSSRDYSFAFCARRSDFRLKLPRELSGDDLARLLRRFGYETSRQRGSHLRLTTHHGGEHHITIPRHSGLRVGTLAGILGDVANHLGIDREELARRLFG